MFLCTLLGIVALATLKHNSADPRTVDNNCRASPVALPRYSVSSAARIDSSDVILAADIAQCTSIAKFHFPGTPCLARNPGKILAATAPGLHVTNKIQ